MDVLHDNSYRKLHQIALVVGQLPGYVSNYTIPDEKQASELSDQFFADEAGRHFPIDSAGSTWLSGAYLALQRAELPMKKASVDYVEARIMEAAKIYGIADAVKKAMDTVTTSLTLFDKTAEANESYGWLVKDAAGNVTARRYPLFDAVSVKKAVAYFEENRHHYPLNVRKEIAGNILRKAADYSVDVPATIMREAGMGIPRTSVLMRELLERAELAKDGENSVLLANVNNLISTMDPGALVDHLDKVAEVIDTFDQAEGLTRYYGTKIMPPADFLYGVSMKEASAFLDKAVKLHRWTFDIEKLASDVPVEIFTATLGEDVIKKAQDKNGKLIPVELAATINKLGQEDKAALEEVIVAICE